jgi:hypothetical protein
MVSRGLGLLLLLLACSSPDTATDLTACAANGTCAAGYTCLPDTKCHRTANISSGNVTVVVGGFLLDPTGAIVLYAGADGSEVATGVLGADGVAKHDLPAGGTVSVVLAGASDIWTWLDVQPGDEIDYGLQFGSPQILGSAHVTPPGEYPSASSYALELGCGGPSSGLDPSAEVAEDLTAGCLDPNGQLAVLAHADDDNGRPIAFSGARGLALSAGSVDVKLPPWQAAVGIQVVLQHPQPWAVSYDVDVGFLVSGIGLGSWSYSATQDNVATPLAVPIPPGKLVDQLTFAVGVNGANPASGLSPTAGVLMVGGAPAPTVTVDLGAVPPHLTSIAVASPGPRPQVTWATDRAYAQAVSALVGLTWSNAQLAHTWTLVGAPASPMTAPPLPAAFAALLPPAGVTDLAVDAIILEDIDDASTYHDWLAKHHGALLDLKAAPSSATRVGLSLATR